MKTVIAINELVIVRFTLWWYFMLIRIARDSVEFSCDLLLIDLRI